MGDAPMDLLLQATPVEAGGALSGSYVWGLLRALLALVAVLLLAWVVLRWLAQRGLGTYASQGGARQLRLVERLPLDAKRSVYLVDVGTRRLLLGVGEGEAPRVLAELSQELPAPTVAGPEGASRDEAAGDR